MVNYIPLNCSAIRKDFSASMHNALENVFKYTQKVNAHVLFDFVAPTSTLGMFDSILFIHIPYQTGNYYRNRNKIYLNSLAIGIRKFDEPEVIDVDYNGLHTEDGSWDYKAEIESDRRSLRNYVYSNMPDIKHFDISIFYYITAQNYPKTFSDDNIFVNSTMFIKSIIDIALDQMKDDKRQCVDNITYRNCQSTDWELFISEFLNKSENHTHHGVLTRQKVEALTKRQTSKLMEKLYDSIGKKLCIVSGNAGTGKTHTLLRIMYNEVRNGDDSPKHNCRLLTYNNMLVADIKQMMKGIGEFTPTKASVDTLHKFFFDIYKKSPVVALHNMDGKLFDKVFKILWVRVLKVNTLIKEYAKDKDLANFPHLRDVVKQYQSQIKKDEEYEVKEYIRYLSTIGDKTLNRLSEYSREYIENKTRIFRENYDLEAFLNGYIDILKELYHIFHNLDEFVNKYGLCHKYIINELMNKEQFAKKYQKIYNDFMAQAEARFNKENPVSEESLSKYEKEKENLYREVEEYYSLLCEPQKKEFLYEATKKIKRKVNWSKYILVDEAQDCLIYEKALLLELYGSDNTIIANGGHNQLIRRPDPNNWTMLFGNSLDHEEITLRAVSRRQKGNIIDFLNAFASAFDLDTQIGGIDEIKGTGRVIIDCRNIGFKIPEDQLESLYKAGKDYGCSNFENMLFLLPTSGYTCYSPNNNENKYDVPIDENYSIHISRPSHNRHLALSLPEELNPIDGTVNDKRNFVNNVGQDNTRCVLYDSCRGLEAWNVMCMDLDTFYYEKYRSQDAEEYGRATGGGLFNEETDFYKKRFAAIWCYMAMTRAMDTLYIKISNTNSEFAQKIINAALTISHVDILGYNDCINSEGQRYKTVQIGN